MDVFDAFVLTEYTFLQISRGGVVGNRIVDSVVTSGVFKLRSGLVRGENAETKASDATLHVVPTESFLAGLNYNLVGHGVSVAGKDYEITGQTGGMNFDTGVMEHYTATLQETDFSNYESTS